jgi:hypothetical protein
MTLPFVFCDLYFVFFRNAVPPSLSYQQLSLAKCVILPAPLSSSP